MDVVDVSGVNQYKVKPWALTSTCLLPMVFSAKVVAPEPEAGADAAGLLPWAAGVQAQPWSRAMKAEAST